MSRLDNAGGRKFIVYLTGLLTSSLLCWFSKISDTIWLTSFMTLTSVFTGANVYEKIKSKLIDSGVSK